MHLKEEENVENDKDTEKADGEKSIGNIVYTIKPLYLVQRCFGMTTFQMVDGEIRSIGWKNKIFGLSCLLTYGVLLLYYCATFISSMSSFNFSFSMIIYIIPAAIALVEYVICAITTSVLTATVNVSFLIAFAEIDTLLSIHKINDFYRKSRKETSQFLIGFFVNVIINVTIFFITLKKIEMISVVLLPVDYFQKFQILVFCRVVLMLRSRLIMINDSLTAFIENQNGKNTNIYTIGERKGKTKVKLNFIGLASNTNIKIRDLAIIYDHIGKICEMINEAFNFQIFMTLVSSVNFCISGSYNVDINSIL